MEGNKRNIEIIYIAGNGRSGSTLLDILLGNMSGHFSIGELSFFSSNGLIDDEYCSCGARVNSCTFWKPVADAWDLVRVLDIKEYNKVYLGNFHNRSILRLIKNLVFPGSNFKQFLADTKELYRIIGEQCNGKILIESSKNPYRLLIFKKLGFNVKVVHLVRELEGVLDSNKKILEKDPEKGVEKELGQSSAYYIIPLFVTINFLCKWFSSGYQRILIRYENLMENTEEELSKICSLNAAFKAQLAAGGPFYAEHLVAGGRVRMEKEIFVKKSIGKMIAYKPKGLAGLLVRLAGKIKW